MINQLFSAIGCLVSAIDHRQRGRYMQSAHEVNGAIELLLYGKRTSLLTNMVFSPNVGNEPQEATEPLDWRYPDDNIS